MNSINSYPEPRHEVGLRFADDLCRERRQLEALLNLSDRASTETPRLALRRYRSLSRQPSSY
jgi:hypothetical protein